MSLPKNLIQCAQRAGLHVEDGDVLFSEDQGRAQCATLSIDRWLVCRDGQIRMELRLLQRGAAGESYEGVSDAPLSSEPMDEAQALQVIEHWGAVSRGIVREFSIQDAQERERFNAFGPRPSRPWEVSSPSDSVERPRG